MLSNDPTTKANISTAVITVDDMSINHSSDKSCYDNDNNNNNNDNSNNNNDISNNNNDISNNNNDISNNDINDNNNNDTNDNNDITLIGDASKDTKVLQLPYILLEDHILVPIKLDITYCGARLVDSFSWNISNNCYMSINEFSLHTCIDLNLPLGFESKITAQIKEQVDGYKNIIYIITNYAPSVVKGWIDKIHEIQVITLGLRHNSLDYTDKVYWNAMSNYLTPESYACKTCKELGLPLEMRPAISFKIREALFRWLLTLLEYPDNMDIRIMEEFKVSETKITMGHHPHTVEMMSNLWKRAKPSAIEDQSSIPQPLLSSDKNTNATVWMM